jgi:Spy/CpxP family protein refolding chaperone
MKAGTKLMLATALVVALALGTAWSLNALAQEEGEKPWPGRGMRGQAGPPDMQEALGLTDEQVSQLRALRFESAKSRITTRSEIQLKRLELRELLQADEPNRAAIDNTLRELSDAQHAALKNQVEQRLAMRQVLTPEQLKKMEGMRRHFRKRMGKRGRRGMHGMHGPRGGFGFGPGGLGRGDRRGFGPGAFEPGEFRPEFEPEFEPALDVEMLEELAEPAL